MQTSTSRRKRRIVNIGDLNKRINLQTRAINSTFQTKINKQTAEFVTYANPWAKVETTRGKTQFDGVELKIAYTHYITIRYRKNMDQTTWVEYEGNRYDIIDIEDLDDRHEFLLLRCKISGDSDADHDSTKG